MNQDRIWEYYQNRAPESFEGSHNRLNFLVKQIKPHSRVLDIGVGAGNFERMALVAGHDVYALDPSETSIQKLRERLKLGEKAQIGYGQNMPFPSNFFDAVVVSEVIEHLSPDVTQAVLVEIGRVLCNGGILLGTVPARENLQESMVVCPHCGEIFHRWGHLQAFTPDTMRELLSPRFTVQVIIERPFITWQQFNWRGKLVHLLRMALWHLGSHSSNEHIFFHAIKR
jgi:SAM-dependent methyltransferase